MSDYVPFIFKDEENLICREIEGKELSVIFDGTSRMREALAIVLRILNDDFSVQYLMILVYYYFCF